MKVVLSGLWHNLSARLLPEETPTKSEPPSLVEAVDEARREWQTARAYFDTVSDPALVDHAIYVMEAAEKKYMYLLRLARENKVIVDLPREEGA